MFQKTRLFKALHFFILLTLVISTVSCNEQSIKNPTSAATPAPSTTLAPVNLQVPFHLISEESLFGYLADLTSIQPYSGWRNSGSSGEVEALDYVTRMLDGFTHLQDTGMELERQSYKIFLTSELWEARLYLTVNGEEIEVPANGLRGNRFSPQLALSLDSDGKSNDSERNPALASSQALIVHDIEIFNSLTTADIKDRILFLDYAIVDTVVNAEYQANGERLMKLINQGLDGVVLVTHYSNQDGESRGTFVGDGGVFQFYDHMARIPVLYIRLEDLEPAKIHTWDDFKSIDMARMIWDADVFNPGQGGNLIARIPGIDSSRAVILTAHVDSPNSPGVFDDGSGTTILLEVARILDSLQAQPPVDLYLVWFGGHELMTYGSAHFVSSHQDLLDRTIGMMGIDGVGHGMEGKLSEITMSFTPYEQYGEKRTPWQDFFVQTMDPYDLSPEKHIVYGLVADNSNFDAFNVPNFNLSTLDSRDWQTQSSAYIHYASHWHDPYETVDIAREVSDVFVGMTKIALTAALEIGRIQTDFKITPDPEQRALFIASHTESDTIAPSMLQNLGMALAWEGFDVDLIPYGQILTPDDLENVSIVVLLPTYDYPGLNLETWSSSEFDLLTDYVANGGFLVVTNSAAGLASSRQLEDLNEDVTDLNPLLEPFGVKFSYGNLGGGVVRMVTDHPLSTDAKYLTSVYSGLQVPMTQDGGVALAPGVIGLVDYGRKGGQVLVIADLGLLRDNADGARNLSFVKNIAQYARSR